MKSLCVVLLFVTIGFLNANSVAADCRDALRTTDKLTQDFRKAARSVSQDCKEDEILCAAAITALNEALNALNTSADNLATECNLTIEPNPENPGPGELVITEINVLADTSGAAFQWFELFNPTDSVLDLSGLLLEWLDESGLSRTGSIEAGAIIQPQSFKVVAFRPDLLETYFGIQNAVRILSDLIETDPNVFLGGFGSGSYLIINSTIGEVDSVGWITSPFTSNETSISRQLDPDAYDAALNTFVNEPNPTNACPGAAGCVWCPSNLTYGTDPIAYGTPGTENTECAGVLVIP